MSLKHPIRIVFWDIDGVIVDSEPLHEAKIIETAKAHGIEISDTQWLNWQGIGDHRIYESLKGMGLTISKSEFLEECEDYYLDNAHLLKVRDGFTEAFNMIAERAVPQVAVSSGLKRQVDVNLEKAGVKDSMLFAVNATEIVKEGLRTKPEPDAYNYALRQFNESLREGDQILPENSLVIEDSEIGVQSGVGAKMMSIHWRLSQDHPRSRLTRYHAYDAVTLTQKVEMVLAA
ncbi:MAG: HAD family phosphatase [Pseudomonadota bacterium]